MVSVVAGAMAGNAESVGVCTESGGTTVLALTVMLPVPDRALEGAPQHLVVLQQVAQAVLPRRIMRQRSRKSHPRC